MRLTPTMMAILGWAIRGCVVLLYVLWVLKGFCMLRHAAENINNVQVVSIRKLPAGHRLGEKDFRFDPPIPAGERNRLPAGIDPKGKYLLTEHSVGQQIAPSEISAISHLHVAKDMLEYLIPLGTQSDLVEVLDPDARVDICSGVCVQNVRVISILCNSAAVPECFAQVEILPSDSNKMTGDMKNYKLLLR